MQTVNFLPGDRTMVVAEGFKKAEDAARQVDIFLHTMRQADGVKYKRTDLAATEKEGNYYFRIEVDEPAVNK